MKLNYKQTILVGLAFFSIQVFWATYDFVIPLIMVNTFAIGNTISGIVMAMDNILALFLLPLFGAISDRTKTKLGRRTPFILMGTGLTVIFAIMLPLINDAQVNHPDNYTLNLTLFIVTLGLTLFTIGTYRSPAVALMPDVTPKPLRSKANAIINLMGALGSIFSLAFIAVFAKEGVESYFPLFLAVASTMAISVTLFFVKIKENKLVEEMKALSITSDVAESNVQESRKLEPNERKSLLYVLSSVFLWFMGYNAIISAFSLYAVNYLSITKGQASLILMVANISAIISFIPIGILSSNIGRKKTILLGIGLLGLSFLGISFFTTLHPIMYVFMVMTGVGWASINVNSYPMVVELATGSDVGKFTGFYYTASMSAQIITPILSGALIEGIGTILFGAGGTYYQILFPYAAVFVVLAAITMLQVKHGDSKPLKKTGLDAYTTPEE